MGRHGVIWRLPSIAYNNITNIRSSVNQNYNAGAIPLKADIVNDFTATVTFTLTKETTIYLTIGTPEGYVAYIDNMKLGSPEQYAFPEAEYKNADIVYEIGFENRLEKPFYYDSKSGQYETGYYSISDEYAHSGKYSVKWDGANNDGWKYLSFTDMSGMLCNVPKLEPNTAYQFSFWYCTKGTGDFYSTGVAFQYDSGEFLQYSSNSSTDWSQIKFNFVTGDNPTGEIIRLCANYNNKKNVATYFDDITLTKIGADILEIYDDGCYCEEYYNKIQNGTFEREINATIWESISASLTRKKVNDNISTTGKYYANVTGDISMLVKIKLNSVYEYRFAFSYRSNHANDLKIGILDSNMNELKPSYGSSFTNTGLLTITQNDGNWHRVGYRFLTPIDGYVYLKITGTNLNIDLDDIMLFKSFLAYEEDPNGAGYYFLNTNESVDDTNELLNYEVNSPDENLINSEEPDSSESNLNDNFKKTNNANTLIKIIIVIFGVVLILMTAIALIIFYKKKKFKS